MQPQTNVTDIQQMMYFFRQSHQTVVSFDRAGQIEDPEIKKMIAGKQVLIVFNTAPEKEQSSGNSFIELMKTGKKISLKNDNLSREWIHNNNNDNDLYR